MPPRNMLLSKEEENFYSEIQEKLKKGAQLQDADLCDFLVRYKDLLKKADVLASTEFFMINFSYAGAILEQSTKIYCKKIDSLCTIVDQIWKCLSTNALKQTRKKSEDDEGGGGEEVEEDQQQQQDAAVNLLQNRRKRGRKGRDCLASEDDFIEIDNYYGRCINESRDTVGECKLKFLEKTPNLFIKSESRRKRVDVCLTKKDDDRDESRLRDWAITENMELQKEIFSAECVITANLTVYETNEDVDTQEEMDRVEEGGEDVFNSSLTVHIDVHDLSNVTSQLLPSDVRSVAGGDVDVDVVAASQPLDRSEEEVFGFRNMRSAKLGGQPNLVNEGDWKQQEFKDVVPSRKLRTGNNLKSMCSACGKHSRKQKKRSDDTSSVHSYLMSLSQPTRTGSRDTPSVDSTSLDTFTQMMTKLKRSDHQFGLLGSFCDAVKDFEGFEQQELTSPEDFADFSKDYEFDFGDLGEPNNDEAEDPSEPYDNHGAVDEDNNNEIPLPTFSLSDACVVDDDDHKDPDDDVDSNSGFKKIVADALCSRQREQMKLEQNKLLGARVSEWHSSLTSKLKLNECRGALDMNTLAEDIMCSFPSTTPSKLTFQQLVQNKHRQDVSRYFLACLQLTNEGNIDIEKSDPAPLSKDCVVLCKMRSERHCQDLSDYNPALNICDDASNKRRRDSSDSEDDLDKSTKKHKKTNNKKRPSDNCKRITNCARSDSILTESDDESTKKHKRTNNKKRPSDSRTQVNHHNYKKKR